MSFFRYLCIMLLHEIVFVIAEYLFMGFIFTLSFLLLVTVCTFLFGVAYVVLKEFFPRFYKLLRRLILRY